MRDFEEMLHSMGFVRIHHSHIINLSHLQSYINKRMAGMLLWTTGQPCRFQAKRAELLALLNNLHKALKISPYTLKQTGACERFPVLFVHSINNKPLILE